MNFWKYAFPFFLALGLCSNVQAQLGQFGVQDGSNFNQALNEKDWQVLREFLNTKRTIDVRDKAKNLTISGDVRTEWRHMTESINGRSIRGHNAFDPYTIIPGILPDGLPISKNDFDIEANLKFDYVTEKTWASSHFQYDNSAGVDDSNVPCNISQDSWHGSGRQNNLNLKRAYMGYNLYKKNKARLDIEIGRRRLYDVFDSKVQFTSRFDGILLKYVKDELGWAKDFYWYGAAFLVDERVNHFAYITEVGVDNIYDTNIDIDYNFVHWNKYGKNRCGGRNPEAFRFQNSQVTAYYSFKPEWTWNKASYVYAGLVYNHDAVRIDWRNVDPFERVNPIFQSTSEEPKEVANSSHPWAWFTGFVIGKVEKQGDWSFVFQYEWVGANAVPDQDAGGIGRGNVLGETITATARGNTNYHGARAEVLYAFTDQLSLDAILEYSRDLKSHIGGTHSYSKFELEAIYAF